MDRQPTPTILVVDDHPDLLENLELTLAADGYSVLTATDGAEALEFLEKRPIDLILADIAMPRVNGYQLYERVRENPDLVLIPFIFLTARTLDSDIRYGKELGVDDYLTKPIQPEDLLAAVQGKLRRAQQLAQSGTAAPPELAAATKPGLIQVGQLEIDSGQHQVWFAGEKIRLSAREFVLLEYLAKQANQLASPQELIKVTHSLDTDAMQAGILLRPLIRSLRRKLGYPVGEMGCLENVRGVGYRLISPQQETPESS